MARVLVTRPEPGATATAERLRALGHEVLVMPLSEIRPLDPDFPDPTGIEAVAGTSANAFRHLRPYPSRPLYERPCFAVGRRTAGAAREAGFSDVRLSDANGRSLARLIAAGLPPNTRILYLCGRIRRPEFEAELAASGMVCETTEVYDTVFLEPDRKTGEMLMDGPPDAVLVYSPRSAEALRRIMLRPAFAPAFADTRFLCLSEAVASALGTVGDGRAYWTRISKEEALFELLAQH